MDNIKTLMDEFSISKEVAETLFADKDQDLEACRRCLKNGGGKIQKINAIRHRFCLSLVDARNRLVACGWSEQKVSDTMRSLTCSDADFCASYVRNKEALNDLGHRCTNSGERLLWHLKIHGIINGSGPRFQWADNITPFVKVALTKLLNDEETFNYDHEALAEHGFDQSGYIKERPEIIIN